MSAVLDTARPRGLPLGPRAWHLLLLLGVLGAWFPLTRYFFALDDFLLVANATWKGPAAIAEFFQPGAWDQFRPLTKGAWFVVMQRLFGLEPFPWHLASLLVHVLNTALVPGVLRRLGAGVPGACFGAALFGLGTASFTVLAWVSCIEVLLPMTFVLLSVRWGLDALDTNRWRERGLSVAAYALALLSMEQALGVPLFLVAAGRLRPRPVRLRYLLQSHAAHLGLLVVYGLFLLLQRGLPEDGAYTWRLGHNALANASAYLAWSGEVLHLLDVRQPRGELVLRASQAIPLAFLLIALLRRRFRVLLLSLAAFLAFFLPVLGLEAHAYRHHVYVPALWLLIPAACALDEAAGLVSAGPRAKGVLAFGLLLGLVLLAGWTIRRNERATAGETDRRLHRVLQQQLVARQLFEDIERLREPGVTPPLVHLVHRVPSRRLRAARVLQAIGGVHGLRLLYDAPELEARFPRIHLADGLEGEVFFYDHYGRCARAPDPWPPPRE